MHACSHPAPLSRRIHLLSLRHYRKSNKKKKKTEARKKAGFIFGQASASSSDKKCRKRGCESGRRISSPTAAANSNGAPPRIDDRREKKKAERGERDKVRHTESKACVKVKAEISHLLPGDSTKRVAPTRQPNTVNVACRSLVRPDREEKRGKRKREIFLIHL